MSLHKSCPRGGGYCQVLYGIWGSVSLFQAASDIVLIILPRSFKTAVPHLPPPITEIPFESVRYLRDIVSSPYVWLWLLDSDSAIILSWFGCWCLSLNSVFPIHHCGSLPNWMFKWFLTEYLTTWGSTSRARYHLNDEWDDAASLFPDNNNPPAKVSSSDFISTSWSHIIYAWLWCNRFQHHYHLVWKIWREPQKV